MCPNPSLKVTAEQGSVVHKFVHDLKNKVGGMAALTELFFEQDEATQRQILALFKQGSMETLRLGEELMIDLGIDRKLELTKIQAQDLSEMVASAIEELALKAKEKNIQLIAHIPPRIMVDSQRRSLQAIAEELIRNAIKFCSGGHKIEVDLSVKNGTCTLVVKDDGPGLSEEEIPDLFQRYLALSNKPTNGESSSLRGLADAQLIATAHNTTIKAESDGKGSGCLFSIELPLSTVSKK